MTAAMIVRQCKGPCGQLRPLSQFYVGKHNSSICKACRCSLAQQTYRWKQIKQHKWRLLRDGKTFCSGRKHYWERINGQIMWIENCTCPRPLSDSEMRRLIGTVSPAKQAALDRKYNKYKLENKP